MGSLKLMLAALLAGAAAPLALSAAQMPVPAPIPTSLPVIQPPLVLWHGMGDNSESDGITEIARLLEIENPGTYVHVVDLSPSARTRPDDSGRRRSPPEDQAATLYGNVTEQVQQVCAQLADSPVLDRFPKINALGFSQGGLFLRALVQECDWFAGKVHSLVTLGSPHNGMAAIPPCKTFDFACKTALSFLKGRAWADWTQSHIVPAQYYRPLAPGGEHRPDLAGEVPPADEYLQHSSFLARVNNEPSCYDRTDPGGGGLAGSWCGPNEQFSARLGRSLRHLAMFAFEADTMLLPPASAWMAATAQAEAGDGLVPADLVPLQSRLFWTADPAGLRHWAEKVASTEGVALFGRWNEQVPPIVGGTGEPVGGRQPGREERPLPKLPLPSRLPAIVFGSLPGEHMRISDGDMRAIAGKFFGPVSTLTPPWAAEHHLDL